jgi:hypothetical protein
MEEKGDISRSVALVLIILTVLISATSTWVLITHSMESDKGSGLGDALVHLNIFKSRVREPVQTDTNSGQVSLYIAKAKEVS